MPRRDTEANFNSDSFLDVIANLVGVLIILIVLAGMRVAQAPVFLAPPALAAIDEPLPELPAPLDDPARIALPAPPRLPEPSPVVAVAEPEPIPEFPPLPPVAPPSALVQSVETLGQSLAAYKEKMAAQQEELKDLTLRRQQAEQEFTAAQSALKSDQTQAATAATTAQQSEQALEKLRQQVDVVEQELSRVTNEPPPVKRLDHQLTPVGRIVAGKEVHFRLAGNRISFVPMDELVARLKADIERRKEVMLTRPAYQGTVGPLQGYTMDYVLQRDGLTLSEEFKYGSGVMRMTVTGWILRPSPEIASESLEEALQPDSLFHQRLYQAGTSATVTCWVYPDSFGLHRSLKQHTHEIGYWVASRPLPEGVPIAGSPNGSKSLAQ